MSPGNPALNIAVRWRLDGGISSAHLKTAFARILERHQPLRSLFAEEDGEPVQVVEPAVALRISEIDLSFLSLDAALAQAQQLARVEARTPFDLSVAPLMRVTHVRLSATRSIVLVTVHHLVCDGWSVGILAHEMGTICAALRAGAVPALPPLPTSYGDYSMAHSQRAPAESRHRDEEFWRHSLGGLKHFELRPDHPRPAVQGASGEIVSVLLERELTQRLAELSRRSGCTLFMTALAALFALLHRYSGETDIAIGTQVSGRDDLELESAVGLFINTIVRRGDLSGQPTFAALLARVRDSVIESFEHLDTPLDRLIEILRPVRDLSRNALFSVNFIFQRSFIADQSYGDLELIDLPSCSAGAMYDLNFFMVERPDGWRASCEYNTDLFEAETVSRLLAHFANLLRAIAADPDQPIGAMPMLDDAERRALTLEWNQTAAEYPKDRTVQRMFGLQAEQTPAAVAVVCGEQSLTYRELDLASNRIAHYLQGRGIGRGCRVGICLDRSPDLLAAVMGVLKAGAAYVPLDPTYPAARLEQIVGDAQPAAVLTTAARRGCLPASAPAVLLESIPRQRDTALGSMSSSEDVAYVIYTSGSTGRPKGVQIRHQALTNLLCSMRIKPGITSADTMLSVTTVSFDMSVPDLFLPLIVGAKLVFAREEEMGDGSALLRLLRRHRATIMQATPVTWQILLTAGWSATDPPLKMLCGGEALTRQLADRLLSQPGELWNMYGPTETTVWSSALRVAPGSGPILIGPPIANTQFYVLDAHGQLAPTGAAGELYIGGDGVAPGYLDRPELTDERFLPDRFTDVAGAQLYRTGDRVRVRAGGTLEFLGRTDHQIKLRGFRIELGEIETVLRAQAAVADCVAVAGPDASGESSIRAYVVATLESPNLAGDLLAAVRQVLPGYMCPASITVLAALPRSPSGKIDREALPRCASTTEKAAPPKSPSAGPELRLAKLWCGVLGIREVAADANFFEIGGHSLLAMRLLVRIQTEFGQKLSLAALFQNPTIVEQGKLLAPGEGSGDSQSFDFQQVLKLQPGGTRPPLIAINNTGIYYALSKRLGRDQPFTSLQLFDPSLPGVSLPRTMEEIAAGYVELIRRVQPAGPYALLGWCVAGALAFEVARQLTAAGESVEQLVLFDTWAPGHLKRLSWIRALLADYAYRWHLIAADWRRVRSGRSTFGAFVGNREIVKKLLQWLRPAASRQPVEPVARDAALSPEQYDQWLLRHLEEAAVAYEPASYSGSMTLFRSSEEPAGWFLDRRMGWGEFVAGRIEVIVVDGDHFSIFREPSVSAIADRIGSADRRAGS